MIYTIKYYFKYKIYTILWSKSVIIIMNSPAWRIVVVVHIIYYYNIMQNVFRFEMHNPL